MRRIVSLLLFMMVFSPVWAQNTYLLSVGISDYMGENSDLTLPVNDAHTIANIYVKNKNSKVKTLYNSAATSKAIKDEMRTLFAGAGKEDIIILFFSGHGTSSGFVTYDGVLEYSEIREIFSECKSVNKMVFADACFSGKLRVPGGRSTNTSKVQNVMFFLSSRSDEVSIESPMMKNGFFTTYLERGLRGGADSDYNRIVTAKELFDFVSKGVKEISSDRQHPVMWGNFSNVMPVIKW